MKVREVHMKRILALCLAVLLVLGFGVAIVGCQGGASTSGSGDSSASKSSQVTYGCAICTKKKELPKSAPVPT